MKTNGGKSTAERLRLNYHVHLARRVRTTASGWWNPSAIAIYGDSHANVLQNPVQHHLRRRRLVLVEMLSNGKGNFAAAEPLGPIVSTGPAASLCGRTVSLQLISKNDCLTELP
jgi:hypothetical protein